MAVRNLSKSMAISEQGEIFYSSEYPDIVKGRFWSKVEIGDKESCWSWLGSTNKKGYGSFSAGRNLRSASKIAHRYAYLFHYGQLNSSLSVCHSCDNPGCCNPYHLWQGTAKENSEDMVEKGRSCRGERQGHTSLTETDVTAIKALSATGRIHQKEIAEMFQIQQQTVSGIVTKKTWRYHNGN